MDKLLTKKDLAERWQVSVRSIDNWISDGVLQPSKDVPVIRFPERYVLELEGVKLEAVSPLKVRKLERELEEAKAETERYRASLASILRESSKVIGG